MEGIFLQCAVLHLQLHLWQQGGGADGVPFLSDDILFIMSLLHNKGACKCIIYCMAKCNNEAPQAGCLSEAVPLFPGIEANSLQTLFFHCLGEV